MKIRKEHLVRAELQGALPEGGAELVWLSLASQLAEEPAFRAQHLLYYFGAMLMLLPLSVMVGTGFLSIGSAGLFVIALLIGGVTFFAADRLHKIGRRLAAGTFAVVSLGLVPLALFSFFRLVGIDLATDAASGYASFHRDISPNYLIIEVLTLCAAAAYLHRFRLPFLVLPVAVALWYFGMDASSRVMGVGITDKAPAWSTFYGLSMMLVAYTTDVRTRHTLSDFSFWLWIFGALTFWGGLSIGDGSELAKAGYAAINLLMVLLSVVVGRRVLAVFGALGLAYYLGHLSTSVFKLDTFFPIVTLALGAGLVWLGVKWPKIEASIALAITSRTHAK